ncbi:hypothetical protein MC885_003929, partial [Smutsia gigantea]
GEALTCSRVGRARTSSLNVVHGEGFAGAQAPGPSPLGQVLSTGLQVNRSCPLAATGGPDPPGPPAMALQVPPPHFPRSSQRGGRGGSHSGRWVVGRQSAGRLRRAWATAPSSGSRFGLHGHPHCCLQANSPRILLLAEQALPEGLEAALARNRCYLFFKLIKFILPPCCLRGLPAARPPAR